MNTYAIRITYEHLVNIDYKACVSFLLKDVKRYYLVNETSKEGVCHLQGWVDLGELKVATFRKHMREFVKSHTEDGESGNKFFSCKQCDEELPPSLLAYFMKEDGNPVTNLLESDLSEAVKRQEEYKQDIRQKKENRKSVLQKIDEIIVKKSEGCGQGMYRADDGELYYWTTETIYDIVMNYTMETKSLVREFFIISLCQTLSLRYVNSYDYTFKNRILEKL